MLLLFALTIPAVTVLVRLKGLPTASTHSPSRISSELLKVLIQETIETISFNASKTLDGKHGEKMPIQEIVEMSVNKILKGKSDE